MTSDLVLLSTAVILGFLHALDVDHMVAVTAFVSRGPTLGTALRFGFRWGIGHSLAVLGAGGILIASGLRWGANYDRVAEAAVGLMLIGIGLWSMRSTRNLHVHLPAEHGDHAHLHTHRGGSSGHAHSHPTAQPDEPHAHASAGITMVGLLHGLAGTTAAVALLPVTLVERANLGLTYLILFGLGVTAGMTLFAGITSLALRRLSRTAIAPGRTISRAVGWTGVLVGLWWIASALGG